MVVYAFSGCTRVLCVDVYISNDESLFFVSVWVCIKCARTWSLVLHFSWYVHTQNTLSLSLSLSRTHTHTHVCACVCTFVCMRVSVCERVTGSMHTSVPRKQSLFSFISHFWTEYLDIPSFFTHIFTSIAMCMCVRACMYMHTCPKSTHSCRCRLAPCNWGEGSRERENEKEKKRDRAMEREKGREKERASERERWHSSIALVSREGYKRYEYVYA